MSWYRYELVWDVGDKRATARGTVDIESASLDALRKIASEHGVKLSECVRGSLNPVKSSWWRFW